MINIAWLEEQEDCIEELYKIIQRYLQGFDDFGNIILNYCIWL